MANHLSTDVRRHRLRAAWTQKEMASLLGCQSPATVCQYEARHREPDLRTALAYQVAFGVPLEQLFPGIAREVEQAVLERAGSLAKRLSGPKASQAAFHKRTAVNAILASGKPPAVLTDQSNSNP